MYKTGRRHKAAHHREYDLYGDIAKIKSALADATYDAKGRASEFIADSFENVRERSSDLQDQVSTYVTKKPLKALGTSLLLGMVIGYFFHK